MRVARWVVVASGVALFALVGCGLGFDVPVSSTAFTAERKAIVGQEVRQFAAAVSRDITQQGPAAWEKHLADSPAFFMASEGKLAFPNRQAATQGISEFTRTIKHIELTWGDDLRVDPLTPEFAVVASSWHEVWSDKEEHQTTEDGFFTGLAERHNGQWQFRNAHWSVAAAPKSP
ncbi:MAG TPA: hypothetical protein VJN92_18960 [Candidatus Acidoferrum sp.]|nr:hypothetical protein [Candidatus Acidoferrum sp.]